MAPMTERIRVVGRSLLALWARAGSFVMAAWFGTISAYYLVGPPIFRGDPPLLGWDAIAYTHAAQALLAGGDPWTTEALGIFFAAPPPSLLPYLPFAALPDIAVAAAWVAIGLLSSIYAIRKLRLPWWWLLFPPVVLGTAAGSTAPLVLALLVRGGLAQELGRDVRGIAANAAAVVLRVYVALPLLLLGRWRALVVAAAALALTAPFLAWPTFIADLPAVQRAIVNQAGGGVSATVSPVLVGVALVALVVLGRRRAAWLIVPALWPQAQLYYASLALPVLGGMPLVALAIASPATPGLIAVGMAAHAVLERLSLRPEPRRLAPDALLAGREGRAARPASASSRARG